MKLIIVILSLRILLILNNSQSITADDNDSDDNGEEEYVITDLYCASCSSLYHSTCRDIYDKKYKNYTYANCTTGIEHCFVKEYRDPDLEGNTILERGCAPRNETCTFHSDTPLCCYCDSSVACNMNNLCNWDDVIDYYDYYNYYDYYDSHSYKIGSNYFKTVAGVVILTMISL